MIKLIIKLELQRLQEEDRGSLDFRLASTIFIYLNKMRSIGGFDQGQIAWHMERKMLGISTTMLANERKRKNHIEGLKDHCRLCYRRFYILINSKALYTYIVLKSL